jgi:tetratricopeptide (TPR) repeat protein
MAQALVAYAKYFELPATVERSGAEMQPDQIAIEMMESTKTDSKAMRRLEMIMGEQLMKMVLMIAPSPDPGPLADALADMPHVFRLPPSVSAQEFVQKLKSLVETIDANKDFYTGFAAAEREVAAGKASEVVDAIKNLEAKGVDSFACQMLLARVYYNLNKLDDALNYGRLAARAKPKSLAARSLVAAIYAKRGEITKAEKVLEMSLDVAETSIGYLVQLGDVYFDQGKVEKSKEAYKKAKSLDPNSKKADEGLLAVSLLEGDFKAAKDSLVAKGLNFDLARFCNIRAVNLTKYGKFPQAEQMYNNTIGLLGNSPDVYKVLFNLGLCLKKAGNVSSALEYFQKCQSSAPKDFDRVQEQIESLRKATPDQAKTS